MKRDEEIVNIAKQKEESQVFCDLVQSPLSQGVNSAYGIGVIEGAKWADKSMIERARKWLEKELYLFYSGAEHWVASRRKVNVTEFLDDFEIAMQEE